MQVRVKNSGGKTKAPGMAEEKLKKTNIFKGHFYRRHCDILSHNLFLTFFFLPAHDDHFAAHLKKNEFAANLKKNEFAAHLRQEPFGSTADKKPFCSKNDKNSIANTPEKNRLAAKLIKKTNFRYVAI